MNKFSSRIISFKETNQFPKLFLDYVSNPERLSSFFSFSNDDPGYIKAAGSLDYNEDIRNVLCSVIREQYSSTGISISEDLISQLGQPGTMTVCTGHQLCLFTGPLYFIYKIISTIKVAEEQSEKLKKNIVPVYWMASEDHDFDEVASVNFFGKTLKWELESKGAVGRIKTDSLKNVLEQLKLLIGENGKELFDKISKAYRAGRTLAQATRELVHGLFVGKILILDGDDARLKKFILPVFKRDLFDKVCEKNVLASIARLGKDGYNAQVNPRKINLFYLKENFRERIEEQDGKFVVLNSNISFSVSEILDEINNHPERFSPNVVTRPLYQQTILPNLAYIGGPGEISYWLEYNTMFGEFGITYPVLQPRNFALLLDKNSAERLSKFEITLEELFGGIEELIKSFVRKNLGASISLDDEKSELKKLFESAKEKIFLVDATLKGAADAELQKQLNAIENLEAKVLKAAKQKQETAISQIRKLREKILPGNILQERYENFISYYLKYGPEFIEELKEKFNLPVEGVSVLTEK